MKFRKNPIIFEAVQFTGENFEELQAFVGTRESGDWDIDANKPHVIQNFNEIGTYLIPSEKNRDAEGELWVAANGSWLPVWMGEWVVKDELGFYPCKNEIIQTNNTMLTPDMEELLRQQEEPKTFGQEIVELINKHSMENHSGTPDWILGNFLEMVLRQFDCAVMMRADWRGESVELPALNSLRGGRESEVPLVIYTDGQRNEVGIAKVKVTPGEVLVEGTITGAIPMFAAEENFGLSIGESKDQTEIELDVPKDEPLDALSGSEAMKDVGEEIPKGLTEGMSRFDRYQKKGLTDNG